jgi:hypothetical protein
VRSPVEQLAALIYCPGKHRDEKIADFCQAYLEGGKFFMRKRLGLWEAKVIKIFLEIFWKIDVLKIRKIYSKLSAVRKFYSSPQ